LIQATLRPKVARPAKGIYFMPDARRFQLLDTATGRVGTLTTLDKPAVGAISVSQGGADAVWAQVDGDTRDPENRTEDINVLPPMEVNQRYRLSATVSGGGSNFPDLQLLPE
jgi:hypothetical protein